LWSLRRRNKQGEQVKLEHNQGCIGEFETALDGEVEAIADNMDFADANQIPGDLTVHSDFENPYVT
jgi:hypothetical protein